MKIEVISVDEETGKVELDLDEEARVWLIEVGFNKVLRDAIEASNERQKSVGRRLMDKYSGALSGLEASDD